MSKNYLELKQHFPDLFEKSEAASLFNATPDEATDSYDANLQFKPGFEEEEQTV